MPLTLEQANRVIAGGDVDAQHAGAVLALRRLDVTGFVDHHHRHRLEARFGGARECAGDDAIGLLEGEGHGDGSRAAVGSRIVPAPSEPAWCRASMPHPRVATV